MRVNIIIPDEWLSLLDELAKDKGLNRSALIRMYCVNGIAKDFGQVSFSDVLELKKKEPRL